MSTEKRNGKLKFALQLILFLLLITATQSAFSQEQDQPEFKMPCAEVLKLGLNKFTDVYGEKTNDYSTYGMKQGLSYYVDCKRPANDIEARRLGASKSKQVDKIRDELSKIGNSTWGMAYYSAGGGTMYGLLSVSAYATREDFMATLINALAAGGTDSLARRRTNANVAKARRLLAIWSHAPKVDAASGESLVQQRATYLQDYRVAKSAVTRLIALIRLLPDKAAEITSARMADELETETGE